MKKFNYRLLFSPFSNSVKVKNKKDAWKKIKRLWPEYNVKKVVILY